MSAPLAAPDRPVVAMTRPIYDNVGNVDRLVRGLAAPLVAAAIVLSLRVLDADWAVSVLLFGYLAVAYLAITAYIRIDPLYYAVGWSTRAAAHRERRERRAGRLRGRPI